MSPAEDDLLLLLLLLLLVLGLEPRSGRTQPEAADHSSHADAAFPAKWPHRSSTVSLPLSLAELPMLPQRPITVGGKFARPPPSAASPTALLVRDDAVVTAAYVTPHNLKLATEHEILSVISTNLLLDVAVEGTREGIASS